MAGQRYERRVIRELSRVFPDLVYHEWLEYTDENGHGVAEPEAYVIRDGTVLLYEIKLVGCRYGHEQLSLLYAPLLAELHRLPVRGLQIARTLAPDSPGPFVGSLAEWIAGDLPLATLAGPDPRFL